MKKIIIICSVFFSILLLTGCTTKLKDGKDALVTFKDSNIATEELYDLLKDKYGAEKLIDLIDTKLLEKEYGKDKDEDETTYVDEQLSTVKSDAEKNSVDFETYISQYYGVTTEAELKESLSLTYRRSKYVEEYVVSKVSDSEIKTYYDSKVTGDMDLSHILISSEAASDASDENKEKAEQKAKETAEEVIEKLNDGADFKKLALEYSNDESNAKKGGALGYINRDGYDENFIEGAIKLKDKTYTKEPVKSQFGYHIIYKAKTKKKPSLSSKKEEIKKTIANEKYEKDSTLSVTAIEALREKYKMKIKDSELKSAYKKIMSDLYNNSQNNQTTGQQ